MTIISPIRSQAAIVALLVWSSAVLADPVQTITSIRQAAEQFILSQVSASNGRQVDAQAGHLDSRLRLSACDTPLETFLPAGGRTLGNTTVGVRCTGKTAWSLFVPVKVSMYEEVVVAARPLSRGRVIGTQDLLLAKKDLATLRAGYYTDVSQVLGKQVKRTISHGAALTTPMVKNTRQIKRGQRVSLVAGSGAIAVRMIGEALADGAAGDRIQVRNLSSKRIVEGTVLSPTTVQVLM
jgi:flagella basal body P-ring formation protein FlgA